MGILAKAVALLVGLLHVWFLILEMFLWQHEIGMKTFGTTAQFAAQSAVLAANQGLYNGFLAAGIFWGILSGKRDVSIFFLACVAVAGLYGGITAKLSIIYIQMMPALLALMLFWLNGRSTDADADTQD